MPMNTKSFSVILVLLALLQHPSRLQAQSSGAQITTNSSDETWGIRQSTACRGKILWVDGDGTVVLYDGVRTNAIQAQGTLGAVDDIVFALGSGSTPGSVIAVWRRGTDSGWVSMDGAPSVPVTAANPINPDQPLNAEGVAVGDGCVFMVLQAAAGNQTVKHVFQVDPATGIATNLTGNAVVPGMEGRLSTSGCQTAWPFLDNTNQVFQLHFYDGAALRVIDTNILGNPHLSKGRIVYAKKMDGVSQIFLYDSISPNPGPSQLTTDTVGTKSFPRTDGQHLAWLFTGDGSTNPEIILYDGLSLTSAETVLPAQFNEFREHPFQLHRGQFLWKDATGRLIYVVGGRPFVVELSPATSFGGNNCCIPWLADGYIAWIGSSQDGGMDREIFESTGAAPEDNQKPSPPLLVVVRLNGVDATVEWDQVLGATSYNLYVAPQPGITKNNYQSLAGGRKFSGVTSPSTITGLTNHTYYFVVTSVAGGVEGPESLPGTATLWNPAGNLTNISIYSVAAGLTNRTTAYAAGGKKVYKTSDGGSTWNALAGGIDGLDVRALAVDGPRIYAATRDFFGGPASQIWRSADAGLSWEAVVPDGGSPGELNKSLAIDPTAPATIYAGDFHLLSMTEPGDSFVIKSTDSGSAWSHLPDPTEPEGAEIRAYAIAISPSEHGTLYVGGSGTPNLVKSVDGGVTWTNVSMGSGYVNCLAIDPVHLDTVYAGNMNFTQVSQGLYKSIDGGRSWTRKNAGFPTPLPRINALLVDPVNPLYIHAATDTGYYFSSEGGDYWTAGNGGLNSPGARLIYSLTLTESRQLIPGTSSGLFVLDLSPFNLTWSSLNVAQFRNDLVLSWSQNAQGFVLEMTDTLASTTPWEVVTNAPAMADGNITVTLDIAGRARFYRLRKP